MSTLIEILTSHALSTKNGLQMRIKNVRPYWVYCVLSDIDVLGKQVAYLATSLKMYSQKLLSAFGLYNLLTGSQDGCQMMHIQSEILSNNSVMHNSTSLLQEEKTSILLLGIYVSLHSIKVTGMPCISLSLLYLVNRLF